jgi:iron-sulfur cluster repair protein YtfE (RIC family)
MTLITQRLRDEHRHLLPHVEQLRSTADSVGDAPPDVVQRKVEECYEFLAHHLIPHAQAEEYALYPVVGKVLGASEATATMSRDHVEVSRLTEELGRLRTALSGEAIEQARAKALRRVLYGLYTLVEVHFAKEEEIYLPLLDARLSPAEADELFESMGHAAGEAKQSTSMH